jgi:hypothetical protein
MPEVSQIPGMFAINRVRIGKRKGQNNQELAGGREAE